MQRRNVRARADMEGNARPAVNRQRIAAAIGARTRAKFPYATYGTTHTVRGDPNSAVYAAMGPTWRGANPEQRANRKQFGYVGRGAYWGKQVGNYLGGLGGGALASVLGPEMAPAGAMLGSKIGGMAGDFLSDKVMKHLSGRGSYNTKTNALINPTSVNRGQHSALDETGDIVISHSEYLQDITPTSAAFQNQYFQVVNPGLTTFLPWLSQMAAFYEEYECIQLVYTFKSMVTEGNQNAAGTVIMATQYNPTSPQFLLKQNMENYDYASSCKVTENLVHGIECDPKKNAGSALEYVRVGPVPVGQDPKTYDLAVVQLATSGCAVGLNIGELWVHYRIRLSKAKICLPGSFSPSVMMSSGYTALLGSVVPVGATCNKLLGTNSGTANVLLSGLTAAVGAGITSSSYNDRVSCTFNSSTNTITFPQWCNNVNIYCEICVYASYRSWYCYLDF